MFFCLAVRAHVWQPYKRTGKIQMVVVITEDVENVYLLLEYRPHVDVSLTCEHDPKLQEYCVTAKPPEQLLSIYFEHHNSTPAQTGIEQLQARLSRVRRHREKQDVLLLHDNAQPYVSHKITDQIRKFGQTTLKHPPYSPELAPCDYHLFGKLKDPFAERG
ncbi:hypothetical protein ANN_26931 [Periplaneta americana]|uniref:Mariner Mos1 transposase n=1 Tax=Periplaneta americana TaxID=6978 RepID=A0ABQ8RWX0_PERAM|nr:hypothetical protein ANN_26931 [Periplaneta americana]